MQKDKEKTSVILPGSYDPVTLGHVDMIRRAAEKYEEVFAVIFINPEKKYTFSLDDRIKMLILATEQFDNVLASASNGLVIDYMKDHGITKIIKGYRNEQDLEYEKKQAKWNLTHGGYETIFWEASDSLREVSSTSAREKIKRGDDLFNTLPQKVIEFIDSRIDKQND